MKKRLLLIAMILSTFTVSVAFAQGADYALTDGLMSKWIRALQSEDIGSFASCYWPEATLFSFNPSETSTLLEGVDSIQSNQASLFAAFDYGAMNLSYPKAARFPSRGNNRVIYVYDNRERFGYIEIFYLERRAGEYRILNQILTMGLPQPAAH
ncbi:MAG TPA: hypothetical protein VMW69_11640 [Spirochaetia bacterium]|nr:hypothetical protein [Spirochaetia bacterium]